MVLLNYKPQTKMYNIIGNVDISGKVDVSEVIFLKKMAGVYD